MKVIFLDVDGVLNSEEFLENNQDEVIDRNNVTVLKNIIDKTGAVIVMSSGWRLWFDEDMMPNDGYSQYLYDILSEFDIKLFDKTPDFSTEEIRTRKTFSHVKAKEIIAWLSEHKTVGKYIVLDDLDLKNEEINSHLVRTNAMVGITEEDGKCAIQYLT
ncbi:HAD domain-containing protein [Clostridium butanoliproducens]|uniref:HAD domain-containing protein n=1 Tax=Clostridium butanoliproducens TaxID=2991837 RepID=UPI0024B90D93|nr:HAD domain-containing protein [Clostridium butanoliproducens]MDU1348759.1 HAD domain-containing protein [Clostridium argentinense]